jgi:hypothetical protein
MKFFTRATFVLLLLSMITMRLVTIDPLAGDSIRTTHVSRSTPHPAEVARLRYRDPQSRTARHWATKTTAHDSDVTYRLITLDDDSRVTPRAVNTFPPYWSSTHLTI